ncbi:uncharacterized protein LOC128246943 [Mya arenaria]|uniref:uncharacterized protein LOC128246943 n=1 Tax=Mya arenaria TaxID=6604 RepID=UPI0022E061C4|nr:uncharacterized protein LOC128246943 [Mya arenaria]
MGLCSYVCSSTFGDLYIWITRLFGLFTAVALLGIAVETLVYGHYLGYVILVEGIIVTFLEVVFGITYIVNLCCSVDTCFKQCWDCVLWLDDWKKAVLFFIFSIPCFIQPSQVWLAVIAGIMLVISAILNIFKTFKTRVEKERKTHTQTPSYDKFEEIHEDGDIDDDDDEDDLEGVITQTGTMTILEDDIGDQVEILEV